jgi:prepilin-type N-terminal cleavage/methylation domain-containing protein
MLCPESKFVSRLDQRAFTLIELVIVIVTLGVLAAVAVPRFVDMADSGKEAATRQELMTLKRAIVGNPAATGGGQYIDRGFEGDIGFVPSALIDLVVKPDSIATYDRLQRLGWNGPYIDSSGGDFALDAWGTPYTYNPGARRIVSTGGGDSIVVTF